MSRSIRQGMRRNVKEDAIRGDFNTIDNSDVCGAIIN